MIANERFGLGDGTGPAEESKRTKRVQGWSRQIGLGTLFAIHTKLFSRKFSVDHRNVSTQFWLNFIKYHFASNIHC